VAGGRTGAGGSVAEVPGPRDHRPVRSLEDEPSKATPVRESALRSGPRWPGGMFEQAPVAATVGPAGAERFPALSTATTS